MAEVTLDLRNVPKAEAYTQLDAHIRAVLDGVTDDVAAMATMSALVHHAFGFLWTGFYRVVEPGRLLRVGPYQGTLGCLEIAFGRGVCGTAAASGIPVIVPDVNAFPGHIACDARSRSEIVIPVHAAGGALLGVLDVDAEQPGAFDDADLAGLSRIVAWFATTRPAPSATLG
ncbi:MAG: GAF domain-containing protein [Gemmatimonadota bacterium]|nr:GAF domain-containing protein [Gemmatimonadota bacterium]MDE3173931.1 GAF domain-containing protein [Gemmatimonadota bacterium]MDE3214765.1 GAF domain-containing protein [Gemmatimonadota bacterium]